jgi:hypothetical protein
MQNARYAIFASQKRIIAGNKGNGNKRKKRGEEIGYAMQCSKMPTLKMRA